MKSFPLQLATISVDLSQVLEIRGDDENGLTLLLGPTHAIEVLVLRDEDAQILRAWLAKDHQRYVEYQEKVLRDTKDNCQRERFRSVSEPPF